MKNFLLETAFEDRTRVS